MSALLLEGDELVAAVGESHYQPALSRLCGSDVWEDVAFDCQAVLVPEPDNAYDHNAIRVEVDSETVAYLSRGDALEYQPAMRQLAKMSMLAVCEARIAGRGRDSPGVTTSNLGIFLRLPTPDEALLQVAEEFIGPEG